MEIDTKDEIKNKINEEIKLPLLRKGHSIFHYLPIGAFESIIKSKRIWFTSIACLNDEKEMIDGYESMGEDLIEKEEYQKRIDEVINKALDTIFVFSASFDSDNLQLWSYYTKESSYSGLNIELDYDLLIKSLVNNNLKILRGNNILYGSIIYEDSIKKEIRENLFYNPFKKIDLKEKKVIFEDKNNVDIYDYNEDSAQMFEKASYYKCIPFSKYPAFINEKEARILIGLDGKTQEHVQFRTRGNFFIPYLELEIDLKAIKSITLGPTGQSELAEITLRKFLQKNGLEIEIKHSRIPVRW